MQKTFNYKEKTFNSGDGTSICGIVNITPDSFSDGGDGIQPTRLWLMP